MKKNKLLINWFFLIAVLFAACSDDTPDVNPPDPPEPPIEEYEEGINLFPSTFEAEKEAQIVFKASSSSELYNYTDDVYVHIGVIDGSEWRYVPATWEENIEKCKMKKLQANVWSITLSPDIRTWFGVREGEFVQKIGILFRSADGLKKGIKEDSFIPVTDTFNPGEIVYEPRPSGTVEGINIINTSTVTFVLYDKDTNGNHYDYSYLIGDFNDWKLDNSYSMKRDDANGCWWYTLTGLNGQTEYAFQYYIGNKTGGGIRLADAYCEKVLDPQDSNIPDPTYPNLRPYPSDKTSGIISTFQTESQPYNWEVTNFRIEDKTNLVIYEMLFRDFTTSGDINGAMQRLGYLKSMGVNAIELMPVQEFDGNDSWGYNPCFYFAMDKAYGTKEMYKRFIDACHKEGIAVILDVVYNHATGANPFAKLYWDAANNQTAPNNPWFNVTAPHPHSVFHDFNHESPLVRAFVKRNLEFLLREYNIDGFRFDLSKGFTQNNTGNSDEQASAYDASRIAILKDYNATIKAVNPDACVILEHFAVMREERELAEDGMVLWRNMNNAYTQAAMGWPENSSFSGLITQGTTVPFGGWVGYMESHDEQRMAFKQTEDGRESLKTNLTTRMKQLGVNAAFFFTAPGPKMIWQFGELGYDISIDENGRTGKKPVKWEYYEEPSRRGLYDTYSKLINFRFENPELVSANANFSWKVSVTDWLNGRFITSTSGNKSMVVVGNFNNDDRTFTVTFPHTGTWYNYMNNTALNVSSATQAITIPANEFRLYTNFAD